MKRLFGFLAAFWLAVILFAPKQVLAANEFSSSYKVTYDVNLDGSTSVTEAVTIKNLTDQYYASSFSLVIGATDITDVSASDPGGALPVTENREGTNTRIIVQFPTQLAGKDKTYTWILKFNSKDFAQSMGKIWQVSVPKIATVDGVDSYDLDLHVPLEFGDPTTILPDPESQSENDGKIVLHYTKDQLTQQGILATFGSNQFFDFNLTYHLSNNSLFPTIAKVPLPPDTNYQEVAINNISPMPENVTIDNDGNYIGWFKVDRYSSEDVKVSGTAKLYVSSRDRMPEILSPQEQQVYTKALQYWESDNPLVTAKLAEIFKNGQPKNNQEKARLIDQYVVNNLKFDDNKKSGGDFSRLGGLTAMNNPNNALCSEYTDLFITLSRAAGVPARELDGYAYTSNTDLRPLSFNGNVLHCWPEYYDPTTGWVMIDPTWQNTTGGVDYFSRFDLNHFVLGIRGYSSTSPTPTNQVDIKFSNAEFNPHPQLTVDMHAPSQFYAGFPSNLKVDILNTGSSTFGQSTLKLNSTEIEIGGKTAVETPRIPPFGRLSYTFPLRVPNLVSNFDDVLVLSIAGQKVTRNVSVRPFFANKLVPVAVFAILGLMVAIYMFVLTLHIRRHRQPKPESTPTEKNKKKIHLPKPKFRKKKKS